MQRDQEIARLSQVRVHARPPIVFGRSHHGCPDDQNRQDRNRNDLATGCRFAVPRVKALHMGLAGQSHCFGQCRRTCWRDKQLDVVIHQHEDMDSKLMCHTALA